MHAILFHLEHEIWKKNPTLHELKASEMSLSNDGD